MFLGLIASRSLKQVNLLDGLRPSKSVPASSRLCKLTPRAMSSSELGSSCFVERATTSALNSNPKDKHSLRVRQSSQGKRLDSVHYVTLAMDNCGKRFDFMRSRDLLTR